MAKILIVEDDLRAADAIAHRLQAAGHTCAVRTDSRGVLELAREGSPDLVVLDVMMPDISGFEICRMIRRDPNLHALPILIVSAMDSEEEIEHGLAQGADAYLPKPLDEEELVLQVERLLRDTSHMAHRDPVTKLPDFDGVKTELRRRIGRRETFALMYIEMLNLRALSSSGGEDVRNKATRHLGELLTHAGGRFSENEFFLGHIGGGDFLCGVPMEDAQAYCDEVQASWDSDTSKLYDSLGLSNVYAELKGTSRGEFRLLRLLFCVTAREASEMVTAQQMLEVVSRIRNNSVSSGLVGVQFDRRL
ncbi:MAG: response regulator [Candidatus Hydrogenedentes bacterium]|nr:response regulator [Candidatus Hydrogenedentota bacterium]